MKVFIGMETSGELRRRFQRQGHFVISVDTLPSDDVTGYGIGPWGGHWEGDVFEVFDILTRQGHVFDLGIFHPTCTYHTTSAAWAFKDPDYARYPGVGYHQKLLPGTLFGEARRHARAQAEADVERIKALPIRRKAMENPRGTIPTRTSLGSPQQVLHPWMCGDDASKATCLWEWNLPPLVFRPQDRVLGRIVEWPRGSGKLVERWANQTDAGQNALTPGEERWKDRSKTYPGVAEVITQQWGVLE